MDNVYNMPTLTERQVLAFIWLDLGVDHGDKCFLIHANKKMTEVDRRSQEA